MGAFTLPGLGQGWGAALVGGNFCPGSHLPRKGTVVLWVTPDVIFGATELPHSPYAPKPSFSLYGGPQGPPRGPEGAQNMFFWTPHPQNRRGGGSKDSGSIGGREFWAAAQ